MYSVFAFCVGILYLYLTFWVDDGRVHEKCTHFPNGKRSIMVNLIIVMVNIRQAATARVCFKKVKEVKIEISFFL